MKRIVILIPNDAVLASIVDPRTLFTGANDFLQARGKDAMFDVQLVGLTKQVEFNNGLFLGAHGCIAA